MILAVDIGNTNVTFGLYIDGRLEVVSRTATDRARTAEQYAVEMSAIISLHKANATDCTGAIIGSVVPELTAVISDAIYLLTLARAKIIGPGVKTGLNIKIDNPAQLGADLVAGAVGALGKYETPMLVLDLGTATKISVIDSNGGYRGCTIGAGVRISLDALSKMTSQLPAISMAGEICPIGTNTVTSMQSGTVLGTAAMLDGMCKRLEKALGEKIKTVVATGGIAADIIKNCETDIISDPNLVLDGLKMIYDKN
mgnify:FL=1